MGARWGTQTRIKMLGGDLIVRTGGPSSPERWVMDMRGMDRRMRDARPIFAAMKPRWLSVTKRVFQSQGIPRWKPLKSSTLRSRRYPGKPILRQSERLFRSVTGGAGMIWNMGPRSLRYGSSVFYGRFHQYGTRRMVKRPFLIWTQQLAQEFRRLALSYARTGKP